MTEATSPVLVHGPVTAEMVPFLTPGRSMLVVEFMGTTRENGPVAFLDALAPDSIGVRHPKMGDGNFPTARLTYIGERESDAPDAFILAPEGGWRSNPVGDNNIDVAFANLVGTSNTMRAQHLDWPTVCAFRLAQPAQQSEAPAGDVGEAEVLAAAKRLNKARLRHLAEQGSSSAGTDMALVINYVLERAAR